MAALTVGKAKIDLDVRGCIKCGFEYSHNWETAKEVTVTFEVDKRKVVRTVSVYVCGDCMEKGENPDA